MQERKNAVLGVEYKLQAPENIAEAVEICGGDEKILLEHFTQKLIYNHHNSEIRSAFLEKVEELSGVKRATEMKDTGKKNEDGTPKLVEVFAESEGEYFARVMASDGSEPSDWSEHMQTIADTTPLDGRRKVRAAGISRLAKQYIEGAQQLVAAGVGEKAAAKLSEELDMEVLPTEEGLAKALKEREDRRRAEFANSLKNLIG
jgi:hypothetical protein